LRRLDLPDVADSNDLWAQTTPTRTYLVAGLMWVARPTLPEFGNHPGAPSPAPVARKARWLVAGGFKRASSGSAALALILWLDLGPARTETGAPLRAPIGFLIRRPDLGRRGARLATMTIARVQTALACLRTGR